MSSAAESAADSAAYLDELTGARQAWIRQCRTALAPDAGAADWAPLTDDTGAWATALRTGRELPDPDDDLPLHPEIADVNAAYAIRTLARHLAGREPVDPAAAADPLLQHCDAVHLRSIGAGSLETLDHLVPDATSHQDRLLGVLHHLAGTGHPAAAYAALLACHLTDTLPAARTPASVPVLYDRDHLSPAEDSPARPGNSGQLTLRVLPGGPPGLHPDPTRMAFFTSVDDGFATSAAHAWASSTLGRTAPAVSVLWNLTLDGRNPAPANDVDGGSLGTAYAIALDELNELHRRDQRLARRIPFLRQLDFRRRVTNPYAAATGTVVDATGTLGAVAGLDHKLAAARRAGITLVITAPGTPHGDSHPQPQLVTVASTQQAIEQARTHHNARFHQTITRVVALALVVVLLAGAGIYLGRLSQSLSRRAAEQQRVAASDRLVNEAVPMLANRPREALRLLEAAGTLHDSPAVNAALVEGLADTHYAGTIDEPAGRVQAVAINRTGRIMADGVATPAGPDTPNGGGSLSLWELSPTSQATATATVTTPAPIRTLTFAPDGQTLYAGEKGGAITVWDIRDRTRPERRQTLQAHSNDVQEITFAPGGAYVATASSDGTIVLFDLDDSGSLRRFQTLPKEASGVFCVAFSPDGSRLFTGNGDGEILVWRITDPRRPRLILRDRIHDALVRSISVGAGGRFLATASFDATINIWDLSKAGQPTLRQTLDAGGKVFQAAFAPNGHTLASAGYNRAALLWEVPDHGAVRPLASLNGHRNYIRGVAFTPDSRRVVTASHDQTMIVWNVAPSSVPTATKTIQDRSTAVRGLAFSRDGRTLAAGGGGGSIRLYDVNDLRSPRLVRTLTGSDAMIYDLAYSPDGRLLAAADAAGVIRLWDLAASPTDPPRVLAGPAGPTAQIYALAFDPSGRTLASGAENKTVALWDVASARPLARWDARSGPVHAVSFDPADPRRLATAGLDASVRIWDIADAAQPALLTTLTGHDEAVLTAGFSPDGKMLASSSVDATTAVWTDTATSGPPVAKLRGHTRDVRTQTFISTDRLITGSEDGSTAIYSLADPNRPVVLGTTEPAEPDEPTEGPSLDRAVLDTAYARHTLATSTREGVITLHDLTQVDNVTGDPHQVACGLTRSGLSPDAWADALPGIPYQASCPG